MAPWPTTGWEIIAWLSKHSHNRSLFLKACCILEQIKWQSPPCSTWIRILPTNLYCFTPASCRRDPIHFCGLFPPKPWWKSHHRDLEWHFLGMAWDAVFTDALSVTRSKGRSEWDSTMTVGKRRFALWKVLNPTIDVIRGPPAACSLKAAFS